MQNLTPQNNIVANYASTFKLEGVAYSRPLRFIRQTCENIMNPTHRDIGVSCKINQTSDYKIYWTMELGTR